MLRQPAADAPDVALHFTLKNMYDQRYPTYSLIHPLSGEILPKPQRPVHHSPSGIAWGYNGSGASDLALLVMSLHFPVDEAAPRTADDVWRQLGYPMDTEEQQDASYERIDLLSSEESQALDERFVDAMERLPVKVYGGQYVSREAWHLYMPFKFDVISPLPQDEATTLSASVVREWYAAQAKAAQKQE